MKLIRYLYTQKRYPNVTVPWKDFFQASLENNFYEAIKEVSFGMIYL